MAIRRILIDCSDTYTYNLQTGIQRTVRNIISRVELIENRLGIPVIPVILTKYGYVPMDNHFLYKEPILREEKLSFKRKVQQFLTNKIKSDVIYYVVQRLWRYYFRVYYTIESILVDFIHYKEFKKNSIELDKDDLLFIIDAFWQPIYGENKFFWKIQEKLKKKGGKVAYLIYDIIPITNRETVNSCFADAFEKNFKKLVQYSDFLITISKSEKKIIGDYLKSHSIDKPIDYFYLGSDLTRFEENKLSQSRISKIVKKPYFLVVGTIEPRKGHSIIIKAFEYLWKEGLEYNLVIAGKVGWGVESLYKRILESEFYGKKLFIYQKVSDLDLQYLYMSSTCLIFASRREGFGLPLVEAMQYNRPVIASDIEVFREVGGDYPLYFDPNNMSELVEKIMLVIKQNKTKGKKPRCLLSWDESVKMLSDKLKKMILTN